MSSADAVKVLELGLGVIQITMQDREHKNAFSKELITGLFAAFERIRSDASCRVALLTGYDSYFCSGGTQEALLMLHAGHARFSDSNLYRLPLDCEIPVVAAMQGHGIGGGFVFGLFADCVVLSRESVYTTNFMRYGFTPGMGATYIVPKKLGIGLAAEMLLSARSYHGADLEKRGIPYPVLPRAGVLECARNLARELAEKPRASLVTLKRHLMSDIRAQLPAVIEREVAMHDATFHLPEVKERIQHAFGK
jgi:polyketide biosynthesis enoyl-CoA hydratase PksI